MPKLRVSQPHSVTVAEARTRIDGLVRELGDKYGLATTWTSESLAEISGRGAKGRIAVGADAVDVSADLPLLLSPMKGAIEAQIKGELRRLFP